MNEKTGDVTSLFLCTGGYIPKATRMKETIKNEKKV